MGDQVGDPLVTDEDLPHLAKFVLRGKNTSEFQHTRRQLPQRKRHSDLRLRTHLGFFSRDAMDGEATLDIVDEAEVLSSLLDANHI